MTRIRLAIFFGMLALLVGAAPLAIGYIASSDVGGRGFVSVYREALAWSLLISPVIAAIAACIPMDDS